MIKHAPVFSDGVGIVVEDVMQLFIGKATMGGSAADEVAHRLFPIDGGTTFGSHHHILYKSQAFGCVVGWESLVVKHETVAAYLGIFRHQANLEVLTAGVEGLLNHTEGGGEVYDGLYGGPGMETLAVQLFNRLDALLVWRCVWFQFVVPCQREADIEKFCIGFLP